MQVLFGVLGPGPRAGEIFSRLTTDTLDSNPGLPLAIEASRDSMVGHVSRRHGSWSEQGGNLSLYLDGEIRSIDGEETTGQGLSERELGLIAALYRVHGPAIWEHLDGSFCLIIHDGRDFLVGVDVSGTRGVYWWLHDDVLAFHSHLLDLAPAYPGRLTEDAGALGNFLECGQYLPSTTAYRQIRHLGAGQYLSVVDGVARAAFHFRMAFGEASDPRPRARAVDELTELLDGSISRCWQNARHPVVPLSGGVDSRYLASELVRRAGDPSGVHTITWGEDRSRADGDGVIAGKVAAALGVENVWFEKRQGHTDETFERAIYLSSGEADCAVDFPEDHLLHAELAGPLGFSSLFRGDHCFGWFDQPRQRPLLTKRAALAAVGIVRMSYDRGYRGILDRDLLDRMVAEQATHVDESMADLRSRTPTGLADEAYYEHRLRRVLAPYNTLKHADLEVYEPYLDRRLLEWVTGIPDELRLGKTLLREALSRRFPVVAAIPFASRSNLPDWAGRWSSDPTVARFFRSWCARPGWLDSIGTKAQILDALEAIEISASSVRATNGPLNSGRYTSGAWRRSVKRTYPGRLFRELTLEIRYARGNLPLYLRLSRLAVLHGLLGQIQQRRAAPTTAPDLALSVDRLTQMTRIS